MPNIDTSSSAKTARMRNKTLAAFTVLNPHKRRPLDASTLMEIKEGDNTYTMKPNAIKDVDSEINRLALAGSN